MTPSVIAVELYTTLIAIGGAHWKHIHGLIVPRDARMQLVTLMRV